jgi:uncharacterized damage-inducible protein DinB
MNTNELVFFFDRDLKKLTAELELYTNEKNIWKTDKNISNSAGHLTLHLIGNLHTFIGKELGKTDYVRKRDLEFTHKSISKEELITRINHTITMVKKSLASLTNKDLKKDYPILKFSKIESNEYLLVHLISHLTYHLGQINYHRRMIDN